MGNKCPTIVRCTPEQCTQDRSPLQWTSPFLHNLATTKPLKLQPMIAPGFFIELKIKKAKDRATYIILHNGGLESGAIFSQLLWHDCLYHLRQYAYQFPELQQLKRTLILKWTELGAHKR